MYFLMLTENSCALFSSLFDLLFFFFFFFLFTCPVDWNLGACLYGFQLLDSRVAALFIAGTSRVFLICFGVQYWLVFEACGIFFHHNCMNY